MSEKKLRVAVVFGGRSGEHQVSLISAQSVMDAMDRSKYDIVPIGITPEGRWLTSGDPMAQLREAQSIDPAGQPAGEGTSALAASGSRELVPGASSAHFPVVDVVFPVLHGTYGEDGTVQGLFELADLPYVGAGILGSVLGLDKAAMKQVLKSEGVPVVDSVTVRRTEWDASPRAVAARVEERFSYPVFVKPANSGSSVGVSKVHDRSDLETAMDLAARYDRKMLVEKAINAREIECSVLGNDEPIASLLGEVVPCNEFYDYRAKYVDGDSKLYIPAQLDESVATRIRELAVKAFLAIDCAGMARVDFFLCRDTGKIYLNELNTIPGFTSISMYPKLWEASGLPYPELVDRLIDLALERHDDKSRTTTVYLVDG